MRQSNNLAIGLYESLGYMIYRRVQAYYGGGPGEKDEDAYGACRLIGNALTCVGWNPDAVLMLPYGSDLRTDMRKSLPRDSEKESVRLPAGFSSGRDVVCQPEDIVF